MKRRKDHVDLIEEKGGIKEDFLCTVQTTCWAMSEGLQICLNLFRYGTLNKSGRPTQSVLNRWLMGELFGVFGSLYWLGFLNDCRYTKWLRYCTRSDTRAEPISLLSHYIFFLMTPALLSPAFFTGSTSTLLDPQMPTGWLFDSTFLSCSWALKSWAKWQGKGQDFSLQKVTPMLLLIPGE